MVTALIEFLNHHAGQGVCDWVAAVATVETDRLVQALRDPGLTVHPAAVALELLQGGRRQPALYAPILIQAMAEQAVGVAAMLVADAHHHQHALPDDLLARFWALLTDPALSGAQCWQAIGVIRDAGLSVPATSLDALRRRPPGDLPADLWLFLFSNLCHFTLGSAAPIDQAMQAACLVFAAGNTDQAIAILTDLLQGGVDYSPTTTMLAYLCQASGNPDRAITELRHILEKQPHNLSCLLALADEYHDREELVASADSLWAALKAIEADQSGSDFSGIVNVIRINCAHRRSIQHRRPEHLEQAVVCYRAALADGVADLALWHNLGMALAELGRDEEAFEALKQARGVVMINFWPKMTAWPDLPTPAAG